MAHGLVPQLQGDGTVDKVNVDYVVMSFVSLRSLWCSSALRTTGRSLTSLRWTVVEPWKFTSAIDEFPQSVSLWSWDHPVVQEEEEAGQYLLGLGLQWLGGCQDCQYYPALPALSVFTLAAICLIWSAKAMMSPLMMPRVVFSIVSIWGRPLRLLVHACPNSLGFLK